MWIIVVNRGKGIGVTMIVEVFPEKTFVAVFDTLEDAQECMSDHTLNVFPHWFFDVGNGLSVQGTPVER